MNNPIHTVLSGSDCPTYEQLLAYVEKRSPVDQQHQIERHLVDCEMCSDEVEGLAAMRDPEQLPAIVEELEQRMAASQSKRFRLNTRMILAAAAVIVLLVGAVFAFRYVVWQSPDTLVSEQVTPAEDSSPLPEALKEEEQKVSIRQDEEPTVLAKKVEEPVKFTAPAITDVSDGATTSDEIEAEIAEEPVLVEEKLASVSDTQATPGMGGVAGVAPEVAAMSRKAAKIDQSAAPSTMKLAMIYFKATEYSSAKNLFRDIIADDSSNNKAIYHLAFCYHELNRDSKALKVLEKILSDSTNNYFQEAQLLKEKISDH